MTGESKRDELRWDARWSYRASPPTAGEGKSRMVIPFENWAAQLGLGEAIERKAPEISDEEIERLFKQGRTGLLPPGA